MENSTLFVSFITNRIEVFEFNPIHMVKSTIFSLIKIYCSFKINLSLAIKSNFSNNFKLLLWVKRIKEQKAKYKFPFEYIFVCNAEVLLIVLNKTGIWLGFSIENIRNKESIWLKNVRQRTCIYIGMFSMTIWYAI